MPELAVGEQADIARELQPPKHGACAPRSRSRQGAPAPSPATRARRSAACGAATPTSPAPPRSATTPAGVVTELTRRGACRLIGETGLKVVAVQVVRPETVRRGRGPPPPAAAHAEPARAPQRPALPGPPRPAPPPIGDNRRGSGRRSSWPWSSITLSGSGRRSTASTRAPRLATQLLRLLLPVGLDRRPVRCLRAQRRWEGAHQASSRRARLDALQQALWDRAMAGNLPAAQAVVRIIQARPSARSDADRQAQASALHPAADRRGAGQRLPPTTQPT